MIFGIYAKDSKLGLWHDIQTEETCIMYSAMLKQNKEPINSKKDDLQIWNKTLKHGFYQIMEIILHLSSKSEK